jgi:MFS family permease
VLPIRGVLYTLTSNTALLVAIQIMDGVGAGIFGVVSVLVIADLTRGTGRFNLTLGAITTAVGIGAALSQVIAGSIVHHMGFRAGFLFLAGVASAAFAILYFFMPETQHTVGNRVTGTARIVVTLIVFAAMLAMVRRTPAPMERGLVDDARGSGDARARPRVALCEAINATLSGKNALLFLLSLLALSLLVGKSGFFDWAAIRCARIAERKRALALPERVRARRHRHGDIPSTRRRSCSRPSCWLS